MQTFLPYADFVASASVLDMRRLGKQRIEAMQLLRGQWPNHPASKMWRGFDKALALYGIRICQEWIRRGYKDNVIQNFLLVDPILAMPHPDPLIPMPPWMGDDRLHSSHRASLRWKSPSYYKDFTDPFEDYFWPGTPDEYTKSNCGDYQSSVSTKEFRRIFSGDFTEGNIR